MRRAYLAMPAAGLGLLLGGWTAMTACGGGSGHCDLGCVTGATIDLESATGDWAPGTYEVDVFANGGTEGGGTSCTLQVADAPSPTAVGPASCTGDVSLQFSPVAQCTMVSVDGASGGECRPVPGHFHQTVTIPGTPGEVTLLLSVNGQQLVDAPVRLTYQPLDGCACQQASAQVTVPLSTADDGGIPE